MKLHITGKSVNDDSEQVACGRKGYEIRTVSYRTADAIFGGHDAKGRDWNELCATCRRTVGLSSAHERRTR